MSCAALDSSVYIVCFSLHLHRVPQLRLGVGFDPLSLAGLIVQSLWVHKPSLAGICLYILLMFYWKVYRKVYC